MICLSAALRGVLVFEIAPLLYGFHVHYFAASLPLFLVPLPFFSVDGTLRWHSKPEHVGAKLKVVRKPKLDNNGPVDCAPLKRSPIIRC